MLARFAYHPSGAVIALADGPDLLVHAGDDERPLWLEHGSVDVAAVGATATEVVSVDASGVLARWDAASGRRGESVDLGAAPAAFALAGSGAVAVALPTAVAVVSGAGVAPSFFGVQGAQAVALDPAGGRLATGDALGRVTVHAVGGGLAGATSLGAPVRSLAWHPGAFWLATAGDSLYRVEADGTSHAVVTRAEGAALDAVACSVDGALVALRLSARTVVVIAYPSRDTAATITYADRAVVGLAFGPAPWLGVGLDRGDGNKIDLRTGAVCRTDPHPGRVRNSWLLQVAVAPSVAMGAPPAPSTPGPRPAPAPDGGFHPLAVVAIVVAFLLLLHLVTEGFSEGR